MKLCGKKGFTLIEIMFSFAIIGFLTVAIAKMYTGGINAWTYGKAGLQLDTEAQLCMATITKFVHAVNGNSVMISRIDANQPANSYMEGVLLDTIYVTTTTGHCCGGGSNAYTVGVPADAVQIFQKDHYLVVVRPVPIPGADPTDPNIAHSTLQGVTLSANLDSLMFTYDNSAASNTILVTARFTKLVTQGKPPLQIFLNKTLVIKHQVSTGYYADQ
jgi:prepilin-type N-terminal cleavage/methylation domain-containing protein